MPIGEVGPPKKVIYHGLGKMRKGPLTLVSNFFFLFFSFLLWQVWYGLAGLSQECFARWGATKTATTLACLAPKRTTGGQEASWSPVVPGWPTTCTVSTVAGPRSCLRRRRQGSHDDMVDKHKVLRRTQGL